MVAPMPPGMGPPPMGPPPGMPPGPGMGPPPGGPGPMAPPPPDPAQDDNIPPMTFKDTTLVRLADMKDQMELDEVRANIVSMPKPYLDLLRKWQAGGGFAAVVLDDILPPIKHEPEYPEYITADGPPTKPTRAQVEEMINRDYEEWSEVRSEIHDMLLVYHMVAAGAFADYDKNKDELFYDESLVGEVNSIIYRHNNTEIKWRFDNQSANLRSDGEKAEDFVGHCFNRTNRRYKRSLNHDIRHDVAFYLSVCGYAIAKTGMRFLDKRHIFDFEFVDPGTAVPTSDNNGLMRVTRHYTDTVANVIANYEYDGGKVESKLLGEKVPGTDRFRRLDEWVTVKTYDDRWWHALYVDDMEITAPTAHEYGMCPWIVQGSFVGEPQALMGFSGSEYPMPVGTAHNGDLRIRQKHQSYFKPLIRGHRQKEAILSKLYTLWKKSDKPSWLWFYDDFSKGQGAPETPKSGAVTPLNKLHEDLKPAIEAINPAIFGTLFQAGTAIEQRTRLPLATFGEMEGTQQSGNQMEVSAESGYEKEIPIISAAESFYTQLGEMWLYMWQNFGWMYFSEGEDGYGTLTVPYHGRRARRYAEASFVMVPEIVRRVGCDVEATLPRLRISGLAALGNGVQVWKGMNLMSDYTALELRGVTDPDEELDEIKFDSTRSDPVIMALDRYRTLRKYDPELAEMYRQNTLEKIDPMAAMGGMMPGGPPGMGGPPAPMGGPPGMGGGPNTSAMNLAALGMGAQGPTGRPPGSISPVDQAGIAAPVTPL